MAFNSVSVGVVVTALAGFISVVELVMSKLVYQHGWPFFMLLALSAAATSAVFAAASLATRASFPEASQRRWVALRALFGVLSMVLGVTAVQAGASPGDVATLTSVNVVFAAMLGQLFLRERLRIVHITAVLCSLCGAVMVARPSFLFGAAEDSAAGSWLGNVLALLSGFLQASVYICARKSKAVSTLWLSCATSSTAVPVFVVLPLTPLAQPEAPGVLLEEPGLASGLVAVMLVTTILAISTSTIGSTLCPAAVSATIFTASSMTWGYVLQVLLFDLLPTPWTLLGAALMLAAVALMALARVQLGPASGEPPLDVVPGLQETALADDASESESLASFVAAEFAGVAPHGTSVRQRRAEEAVPRPQPQSLGASTATSTSL